MSLRLSGRTILPAKSSIRRSLAWFSWNMMLRGMFEVICGGSTILFVAFALALGIPGEKVGRFTIAASLGCIFQVLGLPLLGRIANRKRFVVTLGFIEPLLLATGVLLAPLLPRELRLYLLVGAVFMAAAFMHTMRPVMDDWIASTVPDGLRGRFLGRRAQFWSLGLILATLGAGWAGDHAKGQPWALAGLLAAGAGFGLAAILAISRATMLRTSAMRNVGLADVRRVFREPAFRRYLLGAVIYSMPFLMAVPYYQVYQQTVLKMSPGQISRMLVMYFLSRLALSSKMGRWVDRVGARRMMLLAGPGFALFFLMVATARPDRLWPIYLAWAMVGIADAIYPVALSTALFGTVPATGGAPRVLRRLQPAGDGPLRRRPAHRRKAAPPL